MTLKVAYTLRVMKVRRGGRNLNTYSGDLLRLEYRSSAPLTLLLRVNVFYFYVLALEHHARNWILPSVVDRYLPLSAVLLFDINETRFFWAEYYGIYSSIDKR